MRSWIRIPNLPIELYNPRFLWRVGSAIGQMLKIDRTTSIHSRGRFARICVEIDLAKQLVPRISVLGSELNIEYEGLYQICFNCGRYGHRMDQCGETVVEQVETQKVENVDQKADSGDNQAIDDNQNRSFTDFGIQHDTRPNQNPPNFGPWMMVRRQNEKKKAISSNEKGGNIHEINRGEKLAPEDIVESIEEGRGSRYNILYEENPQDVEVHAMHVDSEKSINNTQDGLQAAKAHNNVEKIQPIYKKILKLGAGKNPQGIRKPNHGLIGLKPNEKGNKLKAKMLEQSLPKAKEHINEASLVIHNKKNSEMEAMELVMLEHMRRLQDDQREAFEISKRMQSPLEAHEGRKSEIRWALTGLLLLKPLAILGVFGVYGMQVILTLFYMIMKGRAILPELFRRGNLVERLDRGLSNLNWQLKFPEAYLKHLPLLKSDHSPICLKFAADPSPNRGKRPFRFLAAWLSHPNFNELVHQSWHVKNSWTEGLLNFKNSLKEWNSNVFGDIWKRKSKILRRLQGITNSLSYSSNSFFEELQVQLWKDYEEVLAHEELLWYQKSRCKWIEFGDRNTKFFHGSTMVRRRKNKVRSLLDDGGILITDKNTLESMAFSFYSNLYMDCLPECPFVLTNDFPTLCEEDRNRVGGDISNMEIKEAVFAMGSFKAPGRDGLQAVFYQSQWDKVGSDLCTLIHRIFHEPEKVQEINETLITLIPKVEPVTSLKQMRPISLCNVSYKVVTKVLANRIRNLMEKLVKPTQCSFVPGRHSSNNIINAQEVIHTMRSKKGPKGWMTIKIDLEKAYDRIKWSFVRDTLLEVGFPNHIIKLIMSCISTARMRVLWNGEELDEFFPSRGIRQGDPLSPYIFVLCIERLSQLVNAAVDHGFWKPIKLNRDGPKLSHLCFADDLILFAEANLQQVDIIKKCLKAFCDSSGQKISNEKTRVYFSKNVGNQVRIEISEALEFARTDNLGKYLGVPLLHSKVSKHTFNDIINKLNSRLNSWKASSLSFAGRTTLVKSVLSSIPLYTMQTALLLVSTCNVIDRKCRSFLWGDTDQSKKNHLMNWDKVCQPKKAGGLGIRHASKMNHTFMMKAGWGLVEKRDSLWATVLRSKYKAGKDIIPNVERKPNSSNMWKGICKSWPDVKQNHIWRIGDGSVIKFWQHNWVPNLGSLDQHVPQVRTNYVEYSSSLMDFLDVSGNWDLNKLNSWLPEDMVKKIAAISPPSPWKMPDHVAWNLSSDGSFDLKQSYQVLCNTPPSYNGTFNLVWRWCGPERVRYFLWLVANNAILTNAERQRRHLSTASSCPRCNIHSETTLHVLRDCAFASAVWDNLLPLAWNQSFFSSNLQDWVSSNLSTSRNWQCLFGVVTSSLWFFRNKLIFEGNSTTVASAIAQIRVRFDEFNRSSRSKVHLNAPYANHARLISWKPPSEDAVKLNVDGSYMAITNNAACGGILRNYLGGFIKGFSCNLGSCSIMHAELWGIVHGLRIATSLNLSCVIVESDSASALKFITQSYPTTHSCSSLIEEIKLQANRIPHVYWNNVPREANSVADQLAKKGQHLPLGLHTFDSAPCEISHIIASDIASVPLFRGI
ncbi:uncharacterized protein [Arachis hypogaea]|uniref:uncharacterized protein n=1 Tax=Arachis hypogaea TaxID=3818 RepID=UPI000DEC9077|nr:uncharacterized protein LOC112729667 [Arachis hypogaea]